jgi:hypothetical protein
MDMKYWRDWKGAGREPPRLGFEPDDREHNRESRHAREKMAQDAAMGSPFHRQLSCRHMYPLEVTGDERRAMALAAIELVYDGWIKCPLSTQACH